MTTKILGKSASSAKKFSVGISKKVSTEEELWNSLDNSLGNLEDLQVLETLARKLLPQDVALELVPKEIDLPLEVGMDVRRRTAAASTIAQLVDTLVLLCSLGK